MYYRETITSFRMKNNENKQPEGDLHLKERMGTARSQLVNQFLSKTNKNTYFLSLFKENLYPLSLKLPL